MSTSSSPPATASNPIKARRVALGWNREDLARRTALEKQIVQLCELDQWTESGALGRIEYVLSAAEAGDLSIQLPPLSTGDGDVVFKMS